MIDHDEIARQKTEDLEQAVKNEVNRFIGVPRNLIRNRAEEAAEEYIKTVIDEDTDERELTKQQYIEMFIEGCKQEIN